jgi:hypothetical protein
MLRKETDPPYPEVAEPATPCLLFENDILSVAMGSFTTNGLHQGKTKQQHSVKRGA